METALNDLRTVAELLRVLTTERGMGAKTAQGFGLFKDSVGATKAEVRFPDGVVQDERWRTFAQLAESKQFEERLKASGTRS